MSLEQRVANLEQALSDTRMDVRTLHRKLKELTDSQKILAMEIDLARERADRDRRIQALELENALLRFEQRLRSNPQEKPSATQPR